MVWVETKSAGKAGLGPAVGFGRDDDLVVQARNQPVPSYRLAKEIVDAAGTQAAHHIRPMHLDSPAADAKPRADLAARQALNDQDQNLPMARRQLGRSPRGLFCESRHAPDILHSQCQGLTPRSV